MQDGRWRWDGDWDVDTSADTDQEGWQYGFAWTSTMGPDCTSTVSRNRLTFFSSGLESDGACCCLLWQSFVRRRRWMRVRRRVDDEELEAC